MTTRTTSAFKYGPYKSKRHAANTYRAAANYLERHPERWCKGQVYTTTDNETCRVCAVGALNIALFGKPNANIDDPYAPQIYMTESDLLGASIPQINDRVETRVTDVVRALRKVARALDHGAAVRF